MHARTRIRTMRLLAAILAAAASIGCPDNGSSRPEGPDLRTIDLTIEPLHQEETVTIAFSVMGWGQEVVIGPFDVTLGVYVDAGRTVEFFPLSAWTHASDLATNERADFTAQIDITNSEAVGMELWIVASADPADAIEEDIETNNTLVLQRLVLPPKMPELEVTACAVPAQIARGSTVDVGATIRNAGELAAVAPFTVEMAAYTDETCTVLLRAPWSWQQDTDLPPGLSASFTTSFASDEADPAGPTYFRANVDTTDAVTERDETNNSTTVASSIAAPDLTVQFLSAPTTIYEGTWFTYAIEARNVGGAVSVPTTVSFGVRSYDTPVGVYDGFLSEWDIPALQPGQTWVHQQEIKLFGYTSGTHGLLVAVDRYFLVNESDETNNEDVSDFTFVVP